MSYFKVFPLPSIYIYIYILVSNACLSIIGNLLIAGFVPLCSIFLLWCILGLIGDPLHPRLRHRRCLSSQSWNGRRCNWDFPPVLDDPYGFLFVSPTTAYQRCLLNRVDNAPSCFLSISSLRKSVLLSTIFFLLTATLLILAIGAYCPYPQNLCGVESLNQHYRLLQQKSQHYQDWRIFWHRHVPPCILLRSC